MTDKLIDYLIKTKERIDLWGSGIITSVRLLIEIAWLALFAGLLAAAALAAIYLRR